MANPTDVSDGSIIEESWGDAVVSRVVGIYSSLAAAEADGRTDVGAVVTLTNGEAWVKQSATALDWERLLATNQIGTVTDFNFTIDASVASIKLAGAAGLPIETVMLAYIQFEDSGDDDHDWYIGLDNVDDKLSIQGGANLFMAFHDSEFSAKAVNTITVHAPAVQFFDDPAESNLRYHLDDDGRHHFYDQDGTIRLRIGGQSEDYNARIFDAAGDLFMEVKAEDDGGSTIEGSPLKGIRSGIGAPNDIDGNDGDAYLRRDATASDRGVYLKVSGTWLKVADHA